jgi:hypothetical protein
LAGHLKRAGHVLVGASDLPIDARSHRYDIERGTLFVTSPPWTRDVMHAIVANLSDQAPLWALIDSDWLFTKQAAPFMPRLRRIVAVGRVKWIADSPHTGKDNAAWMLFNPCAPPGASFVGRTQ